MKVDYYITYIDENKKKQYSAFTDRKTALACYRALIDTNHYISSLAAYYKCKDVTIAFNKESDIFVVTHKDFSGEYVHLATVRAKNHFDALVLSAGGFTGYIAADNWRDATYCVTRSRNCKAKYFKYGRG